MASYPIASCERTAVPNWVELPRDITANILQRLDTIDIVTRACLVCPTWWNIFKDPCMWRTIRMNNFNQFPYYEPLMEICHYAIEQSCGHLEYISIENFATDDLLKFIAENASNLRNLRLVNCDRISNKGFSEAVKKLQLLEKLSILYCNVSTDALEVVGQHCPLLTFLQLVRPLCEYWVDDVYDKDAFVIAKTMFGLRHLNIRRNKLTNGGLLAILDGCPHLESLDIRRCYNLQLDESLKKKCFDQIKNLRLPESAIWDFIIDEDCYND